MVQHFSDSDFTQEVLASDVPVMVDFYADWCGPCRMVAPIVEELAGEYAGKVKIGKINVDENPNTAKQYNVMSIPTILFIKGGKVVDQVIGALPKASLQQKLNLL
ncbi:MAG TPA: thioredoxin [Candidatus Faecimorpha stercoravium]|nr:thioredoxin [Candidatus Faecimorpha stercoravium]